MGGNGLMLWHGRELLLMLAARLCLVAARLAWRLRDRGGVVRGVVAVHGGGRGRVSRVQPPL